MVLSQVQSLGDAPLFPHRKDTTPLKEPIKNGIILQEKDHLHLYAWFGMNLSHFNMVCFILIATGAL